MNQYKKIWRLLGGAKTIVIARHVGPDPDCLGAQFALRDVLKQEFPNKNIYAIGAINSKQKYLGKLDKLNDEELEKDCLVVLDTPNIDRIDGVPDITLYKNIIKIDHHEFIEDFGGVELVDVSAGSTCMLIYNLFTANKIVLNNEIATLLYTGVVSDTNRFLYNVDANTFKKMYELLTSYSIDTDSLYKQMYLRTIDDFRFQGYIMSNMKMTEEGLMYIEISAEELKEFKAEKIGALINELAYIEGVKIRCIIVEDANQKVFKVFVRSEGVIINDILEQFGGGGHTHAAGVRLKDNAVIPDLLEVLKARCIGEV